LSARWRMRPREKYRRNHFGTGTVLVQFPPERRLCAVLAIQEMVDSFRQDDLAYRVDPDTVVALPTGVVPLFPASRKRHDGGADPIQR